MGKCVLCSKFFHPDLCIEVDEKKVKCVFCHLGKDFITIVDEETKREEKLTKEKASESYIRYLEEVSKSPKVAELILKNKGTMLQ
jgi:hypothetical protein